MEVGDLVQLSSYGKKISVNHNFIGKVGVIVHWDWNKDKYAIFRVHWAASGFMYHIRRDLKKVKTS